MSETGGGRRRSIDLLRAVAIVLMVIVHFAENLSGWYGGAANAFAGVHHTWWLPTGFAAPIFTLLAGVSYRLRIEQQRQRGRGDGSIAKETVRRGLLLVGLGFAFNVLVWLPDDVFNWDILTLIGVALLTLAAARWVPDAAILFTAVVIVAVAPAARAAAGYSDFWAEGFFDYDFTVRDVTLGWLVTGYFPVFPWLAFPLAGYAAAPWLVGSPAGSGEPVATPGRSGLLAGLALIAASAAAIGLRAALPAASGDGETVWGMFPATTAYVLGTLGGAMTGLALAHRLLDPRPDRWRGVMEWATPLSRHALSIYLLHHAVHVWPLWAVGLATRGKTTALWQVAMPVWWSLALAAAFLVAAVILFHWVDRRRVPTAETVVRWLCE